MFEGAAGSVSGVLLIFWIGQSAFKSGVKRDWIRTLPLLEKTFRSLVVEGITGIANWSLFMQKTSR